MLGGVLEQAAEAAGKRLDLGQVEAAMRAELASGSEGLLARAERHLCLTPGAKRARPQLVFLLGEVTGAPAGALLDAAVAIELIHSASLLHDDVIDAGELRRGAPTVNAAFGNFVAVLAGDHLLSRALVRLSRHTPALSRRAAEVVAEMARAAVRELEVRGDATLSPESWREIAIGKTAALFGLCGYAAGILGGDEARARRFDLAARSLGVAFQMQDDLGDLIDEKQDRYGDIREANASLPVLLACEQSASLGAALGQAWREVPLSVERAREMGLQVLGTDAVDRTLASIRTDVEAARHALGPEAGHPAVDLIWVFADSLLADPRRASVA